MDDILNCANNFRHLLNVQYHFVVSKSRRIQEIYLDFVPSDFFHLCGFQYLTDIQLPQNRKKTLSFIQNQKITDQMLRKSKFYFHASGSNHDVAARIHELQFLEQYLDIQNIIRIFSTRNSNIPSLIRADYVIESSLGIGHPTVYAFLTRRHKDSTSTFCLNSFFVKRKITYGGELLYWMLKEKIEDKTVNTLYQHKNYKPIPDQK